jgi:hypothetical protein
MTLRRNPILNLAEDRHGTIATGHAHLSPTRRHLGRPRHDHTHFPGAHAAPATDHIAIPIAGGNWSAQFHILVQLIQRMPKKIQRSEKRPEYRGFWNALRVVLRRRFTASRIPQALACKRLMVSSWFNRFYPCGESMKKKAAA